MLISYSHKFIFFHIPKTAGVSIRTALDPYAHITTKWMANRILIRLRLRSIFNKSPYHKFRSYIRHFPASKAKKTLPPQIFSGYYKFTFVRNPWDWQVSLYHYILKTPNNPVHSIVKDLKNFEAYLYWCVSDNKRLQHEFIADKNGNLLVDFIGRYENLADDFDNVCKSNDIENCSLPHLNESAHKEYQSYYNSQTIDLVAEHYKEDIELFGYSFE